MNTPPQSLDTNQAASVVALPTQAIEALAEAGYIDSGSVPGQSRRFNLTDLKAFVARNADNGAGTELRQHIFEPDLDPAELIEMLDERTEHMALRMLKMYATVFPQVQNWSIERQSHFVLRTKERFEAIMAVALGDDFDEEFLTDLRRIGSNAARRGVELPEILVLLRISRDLVVQNAIEIAGQDDRHGSFALSLLLTRILPAMDRLSDTLAAGYWQAVSRPGDPAR